MTISKAETFRNVAYSGFGKGLTLVCGALTSMVVARNLTPSDYGVVGFAWIIIAFLSQFSDLGLANAVIRRPALHPHSLHTAFTLKLVLGFGACAAAFLIAPFARHLFDHPATGNVIRVLSLTFLVSTIGFAPQVMLTREMNYRALIIPAVAGAVTQCILAVTLVLHGWSYWAVVIGSVGGALVSGIAMQLLARVPIGFRFDLADAKEFLRFGIPLFGTGILVFAIFNLDNFLVGESMGSSKLGYYALAFTWGSFICGILTATVNNVLFPTFSALQNDPGAVRRWYLKSVDLVAFVAVIVNGALFANTHYFLVTFLGKGTGKWLPAEMALRVLCVYGIARATLEPLSPCFMARGQTSPLLKATVVAAAIELTLLLLALRSGSIEMVAWAVLAAYVSQAIVYLPLLRKDFSIEPGDVVATIWPIIPAFGAGWLITFLLPSSFGTTFPSFIVRGIFTASVVGLTHGLFSRFRCFNEMGGMISQTLPKEVRTA
ncbi:MAG TPA: lipopolysaccharide biosynthesis protein [Acidobacteriaceae bacterium]|jgi:O-antigen/teichoic acid export membrane protein|nr:lipopolysaccharide biosynthesis protein [Acidobacteriaceae bacterium]